LKPLFFNQIRPIIKKIMSEYDASIILEKNSVIWSLVSIDITNLIVERVDEAFMDANGSQASEPKN
jgi:Skp family chaperone for outer membrane proteins